MKTIKILGVPLNEVGYLGEELNERILVVGRLFNTLRNGFLSGEK